VERDPQAPQQPPGAGGVHPPAWHRAALPPSPPTYDPQRGYPADQPRHLVAPPPPAAPPPPGGRPGASLLTVLAVALAVALVTSFVVNRLDDGLSDGPLAGGSLDIKALLLKAEPSVVAVLVPPDSITGVGRSGSGIIISEDGLVLTNAHVVGNAAAVRLTLADGRELDAELVGSMPDDDVALVQVVRPSGLVAAELASSDAAEVGDDVVAIGNALGLGGSLSVTSGIISAKGRDVSPPGVALSNLIQTDAAINQGNSGGPLVDARGRVIGINTAVLSQAQNIGFAIPIDQVKPLISQLRAGQGAVRPDMASLGVTSLPVADVSRDELDELGITASRGTVVRDVVPGSPAEGAGLAPGDVIVSVDGQAITEPKQLSELIRSKEAGDVVIVEFEREGRRQRVEALLTRWDDLHD
jgi:S1-C subfamily serine protease